MNASKDFPNLTDNEVQYYWREVKQMVTDGFIDRLQIYDYVQTQNDLRA